MSPLEAIAEVLRAEGGLLAEALCPLDERPSPGALLAGAPRAARAPEEYVFVVEAIYEAYLLHYDTPRVLACPDADLALLAGDRLYALGLERLVGLGDIEALRELADVISLCALVHGRGAGRLAPAIWEAGVRAVGWGGGAGHERAKRLVAAGDPEAEISLRGPG